MSFLPGLERFVEPLRRSTVGALAGMPEFVMEDLGPSSTLVVKFKARTTARRSRRRSACPSGKGNRTASGFRRAASRVSLTAVRRPWRGRREPEELTRTGERPASRVVVQEPTP